MRRLVILMGLFYSGFLKPLLQGTIMAPVTRDLQVVLNHSLKVRVDERGSFVFNDVPEGRHRLTVYSLEYEFPEYEIESTDKEIKIFEVNHTEKSIKLVPHPLLVHRLGTKQYFEIKQPFNIADFLKSPYGIMIGVSLALFLCMKNMPKMEDLQNVDRVNRNN